MKLNASLSKHKKALTEKSGSKYAELEDSLKRKFENDREKEFKIQVKDLREDGLKIAQRDGIDGFKASENWSLSFKKNNISWKKLQQLK